MPPGRHSRTMQPHPIPVSLSASSWPIGVAVRFPTSSCMQTGQAGLFSLVILPDRIYVRDVLPWTCSGRLHAATRICERVIPFGASTSQKSSRWPTGAGVGGETWARARSISRLTRLHRHPAGRPMATMPRVGSTAWSLRRLQGCRHGLDD
jgi:hypothetical protein